MVGQSKYRLVESSLTLNYRYVAMHWTTIGHCHTKHNKAEAKLPPLSQMTFSNAFSWMNMYEFCIKLHWDLFLKFELIIFQHWFKEWLGTDQATNHYLNQWWLVCWCIYVSLDLNELSAPGVSGELFPWWIMKETHSWTTHNFVDTSSIFIIQISMSLS